MGMNIYSSDVIDTHLLMNNMEFLNYRGLNWGILSHVLLLQILNMVSVNRSSYKVMHFTLPETCLITYKKITIAHNIDLQCLMS